jgi:hypothetical protein
MKTLYERSLEALVAQLEAENERLRAAVTPSPAVAAPAEETSQLPLYVVPRIGRSSQPPPEKSGAPTSDEKRAVLFARGWTHHEEIYEQNIPVCWERGAKWYSLDDAYKVELGELSESAAVSS